ncbi:penicillin-binding protein 2 [Dethiosulfatarculus sandiegensis]|uniref:penicillin-binding protein 2 n=1 Tax=Dethiosulfatarculus sandiegensis TaxID=1429043 RepID=UPI000697478A|nr:penicillin-binding protein 2 [Dethiosulfatarculus sandiegensis]
MNLYKGNSSVWLDNKARAAESGQSPVTKKILLAGSLLVGLAFAALIARLWYMQLLQGDHFRKLSENNRVRLVDVSPSRGLILDSKGRLLADNRPTFTLAVVPEDVPDWKLLSRRLQELVGITTEEIKKARLAAKGQPPFKPVRIRSHLDREQLAILETFRYELAGVKVLVEYRRAYLAARETAHLVGYLGEINSKELSRYPKSVYRLGDYVGRYGLESAYERVLHGKRGARQVEVDAMGRELNLLDKVDAASGHNLVLSIDLDMQKAAAKALGDETGAVVAMNPQNGEVYCLYSSPTFDQNNFIWGMTSGQWKSLANDKKHPLKNRAISGNYPPGSTYKIVTAAAGLEEGVITPETTFFCPGQIHFGRRFYKCWKKGGHGTVNLQRALSESCDVYFYRLGQKLGIDRLAKYAKAFGLGKRTNISLPHESIGLVPSTAWKKRRFGEVWHEGETLSAAIGQGFNLTTPLQLARMVSVVANGGRLVTPTLVKRMVVSGKQDPVPAPKAVTTKVNIKPEHLRTIHQGLVDVVNSPRGTARRVRLPGITVAGKTGTAQVVGLKFERSFGKEEDVPWKYRSHALFVCYAPAENPTIAVAVVVEHGGHGGSDAGPVAKKVMEEFFGINKKETIQAAAGVSEVSGD